MSHIHTYIPGNHVLKRVSEFVQLTLRPGEPLLYFCHLLCQHVSLALESFSSVALSFSIGLVLIHMMMYMYIYVCMYKHIHLSLALESFSSVALSLSIGLVLIHMMMYMYMYVCMR